MAERGGVNVLVLDNYDSFTYNLVHYIEELGAHADVLRSDAAGVEALLARRPDGLVISPGPGGPERGGVSVAAARRFAGQGVPVLGVCLGHQALGAAFGGRVVRARAPVHGKASPVHHTGRGVFRGLPSPFEAARYHSLVIDSDSCPSALEVTARTPEGEIMGVRHRRLPAEGVQFHPESILTGEGRRLLGNFLERCAPQRACA